MPTLDDFFTTPTENMHPRVRNWKTRLGESGTSAVLEVSRPETAFGLSQAEMHVQLFKNGSLEPLESLAWDDDLNAGLIQLGVRAVNKEQEAQRFALGLREALRKAARDFGDGYFNSVLVDLLKDSDLADHAEVREVLEHICTNPPHREDGPDDSYTICRELITNAISGRAGELTGPLKYSQDEAKQILVSALAHYLDERFSVSRRRRMGLL